ncbi:hypothetical protein KFU94_27295 [Chloroflexi bacterium TSY]|nr:hypothetical protein [Chloroflexi bacterium TSY]
MASELVHQVYLPIVTSQQPMGIVPAHDASFDFNIDPNPTVTRLISLAENGGRLDTTESHHALTCGNQARLEVHVFGSKGEAARLDHVIVQVVHTDEKGMQWEELKWTGSETNESGVVRFLLHERAEVRIITDVDGRKVSSASMNVTTDPGKISFDRLQSAGYCSDTQSCSELIQADRCEGNYSWNVVFKRRD